MRGSDSYLYRAIEALRGAQVELAAMVDSYEDYVPSGRLMGQLEDAIQELSEQYYARYGEEI